MSKTGINDRVNEVMKDSGKSKTELASMLDVSLAQLSHISSGRNKPGLELIQKLTTQFPEISAEWILNGEEPKYRTQRNQAAFLLWIQQAEQQLRQAQLDLRELELHLKEFKQP